MHDNHTILRAAIAYAARGWRVIPLHHPLVTAQGVRCSCAHGASCPPTNVGKHPRIGDWPTMATTDEVQIFAWWKQWPQSNLGLVSGKASGLAIVDVDPRNLGDTSLEELQQLYQPLPDTPMVLTGGGGWHYYFSTDDDLPSVDLAPGINFLADTSHMVVAPPSVHRSGRIYCWEWSAHSDETPLANLPEWIMGLVHDASRTETRGAASLPDDLPEVALDALRISPRMRQVVATGNDAQHPYPSRSEAVFAVVAALIAGGHDDGTIASVVLNPAWGISDKPLGQRNPHSPMYWPLTRQWVAKEIARARAKVRLQESYTPRRVPLDQVDAMMAGIGDDGTLHHELLAQHERRNTGTPPLVSRAPIPRLTRRLTRRII